MDLLEAREHPVETVTERGTPSKEEQSENSPSLSVVGIFGTVICYLIYWLV